MAVRIILVGTTHPGNIGAVARAMKNMGLSDLVLVEPRFFPHDEATARASGAADLLDSARVVATLEEALRDCIFVAGASARSRSIDWPGLAPRECAARLCRESARGTVAVVFGPEKSGLKNEHLDRCHALLTIPTDPAFSSLNLAMAVQVLTYEIKLALDGNDAVSPQSGAPPPESPPATGEEMEHFYQHLEAVMVASGFLDPENPRHLMRRLRRLFIKASPDKNEVNILRGLLTAVDPGARNDKP